MEKTASDIRITKRNEHIPTPEEVIEKYDAYKEEKISADAWADFVLRALDRYVIQKVQKWCSTVDEDLVQECRITIIEKIKEYDPRKSSLTVFFTPHINETLWQKTDFGMMTTSDKKILNHMNKLLKEFGFPRGLEDPELANNPARVARILKMSVITVEHLMSYGNRSLEYLDDESNEIQNLVSRTPTPEEAAEQSFLHEAVQKMLEPFSEFDRYLIEARVMRGTPISLSQIVTHCNNNDAFRKKYGITDRVNSAQLQGRINSIMAQLKNSSNVQNYIGKRNVYYEINEQASFNEIKQNIGDM